MHHLWLIECGTFEGVVGGEWCKACKSPSVDIIRIDFHWELQRCIFWPEWKVSWHFYRTRVRSLAMLATNWLTNWLIHSCLVNLMLVNDANCLIMSQQLLKAVKMPTQNLLLMLAMRIVLETVCCRFGSWGLVIKLNFCSDFEQFGQDFKAEVQARFWSWSLVSVLLLVFGWCYEVESRSIFWS